MKHTPQYQEFWPEAGPSSMPGLHQSDRRCRRWTIKTLALSGVFLVLFAGLTSLSTILMMQTQTPERVAQYFSSSPAPFTPSPVHETQNPSYQSVTTSPQILLGKTLHQLSLANYTNTYSQFHHLASPAFQRVNSAQKLRDIFAWMRRHQVNLSNGATLRPLHVHSAEIDKKGFLNISGVISAQPKPLNVKAAYQENSGVWKLFGIHVALQR